MSEAQAIDWKALLEKVPQLIPLILQIIGLFEKKPMFATENMHCSKECLALILCEREHLVMALLHNLELEKCCGH